MARAFVVGLLAGCVVAMAIVASFKYGVDVGRKSVNDDVTKEAFTRGYTSGMNLTSDRVECFEWVSRTMDKPTAGVFALMCAGEKQ